MIWIKICGTTNLEDAVASIEAGANALGFIFAPSPRRIGPREAGKIIRELPSKIEKIGVFVNQKPEIIRQTVEDAGLSGVQLHGDEDLHSAFELREQLPKKVALYRAISISAFEGDGLLQLGESEEPFRAVLLDSGNSAKRGGTGTRFDWLQAAPMAQFVGERVPIIVAGGLTPQNVREAVHVFAPFGVDVVSGVECEPGKKDHAKVKAFIAAARDASKPQ